jgi:hypothetical protein
VETGRAEALELAKGLEATASNIERLSKKTNAAAAQWAFGQWELRKKAVKKGFPRAEEMLFDQSALEQSTHFEIARYHASLFPAGTLVADLTCGIGSDLIALAERGPVIGYDTNAKKLEYARHNLSVFGLAGDLVLDDSLKADWKFDYAFADPSRRPYHSNGYRFAKLALCEPDPVGLADRMAALKFGLMKLSPMFPDEMLFSVGKRVDFVSYGRECRESLIYLGADIGRASIGPATTEIVQTGPYRLPIDMVGGLPLPGCESYAVHVESGELLPQSDPPKAIEEPKAFLYEADPAAIRAHGLGHLATQHQLYGLGDSNGYLTSDGAAPSPWLTAFKVLTYGRFDKKTLRARLAELGGGKPIVKSRASHIDVVQARRDLTVKGSGEPIVAIYPVGASLRYAVLERV